MVKKDFLIIANGEPSGSEAALARDRVVMALDGAADYLRVIGIKPDVLLGDFDSLKEAEYWGVQYTFDALMEAPVCYRGREGVVIVPFKDQNETDLAKGITYCDACGATSIAIVNAGGGRLDYALGNIHMLRRFHRSERPLAFYSGREVLRFVKDSQFAFTAPVGSRCAVLAAPRAVVSSQGLEYEMEGLEMEIGWSESLSNRIAGERASLWIEGEALVISSENAD